MYIYIYLHIYICIVELGIMFMSLLCTILLCIDGLRASDQTHRRGGRVRHLRAKTRCSRQGRWFRETGFLTTLKGTFALVAEP